MRTVSTLALFVVFGCPNQVSPIDARPSTDSGVPDGPVVDTGVPDTGTPDGGTGPVIDVVVAYTAAADEELLYELYVSESSAVHHKVNPTLAGGEKTGGKGDPQGAGVLRFEWYGDGSALIYSAHQDTYDIREIYYAPTPGRIPNGQTYKQSVPTATDETSGYEVIGNSMLFFQYVDGFQGAFLREIGTSTAAYRLNRGQPSNVFPSPGGRWLTFSDILVPPNEERDLWVTLTRIFPPAPFRVNAGTNVGWGGSVAWTGDIQWMAYTADDNQDGVFELFRYELATGENGPRERMTPNLAATADVKSGRGSVAFSPSGAKLAYLLTDGTTQLMEIDVFESAPRTHLLLGMDVKRFEYDPSSTYVSYVNELDELFVTRSGTTAAGVRVHDAQPAQTRVLGEYWGANELYFTLTGPNVMTKGYVVDLSTWPPPPPEEIPWPNTLLSPESFHSRYVVYRDTEFPPNLWILDRTEQTPTPRMLVSDSAAWCWSNDDDSLAVITRFADTDPYELYLIEDPMDPMPVKISLPVIPTGGVNACAFPPPQGD